MKLDTYKQNKFIINLGEKSYKFHWNWWIGQTWNLLVDLF